MVSEVIVMSISTRSRTGTPTRSGGGARDLRRAWTSLALLLVFSVGAVWGMNTVAWEPSFWISELVLVAGTLIALVFAAGGIFFGRRALRAGEEGGRAPVVIGSTVGALSIAWAVIPIIARLLGFE
jgi:hypothetical protein